MSQCLLHADKRILIYAKCIILGESTLNFMLELLRSMYPINDIIIGFYSNP